MKEAGCGTCITAYPDEFGQYLCVHVRLNSGQRQRHRATSGATRAVTGRPAACWEMESLERAEVRIYEAGLL
jgi:hypothetical protein